jgi:Tol biopolymer transport system component
MKRRSRAIVALTGRRLVAALGVPGCVAACLVLAGTAAAPASASPRPAQAARFDGAGPAALARPGNVARAGPGALGGPVGPGGSPGAPANGRITFTRLDPKLGNFSIWAANPDGTHQQRLTHTPSQDNDWSPNGRRIAFDFFNKTGEHLATMDPNGRHVRQLTFKKGIQDAPKWSPNGQRITFDASPTFPDQPGFHTSIWTMRANGTGARQLTHGIFGVEPVYSPDGRRIAFGRITGFDAQGFQLEAIDVINTDGTHLRQVVPPLADLEHPDWSPNGTWITFNIAPEAPNAAVMAVHPNGKGLRVLRASDSRFGFFKPVWSPDGREFLVGCHDFQAGIDKLCVMNANGRNLHVIVAGPEPVNNPAWGTHPLTH